MTDGTAPFDLEPDAPRKAPEAAPARAAHHGRPTRKRRVARGAPTPDSEPRAPTEAGRFGRCAWGFFTSPRFFYALTSALGIALLFTLFNPSFGLQAKVWFWEALRGKGSIYPFAWNPTLLQAVALPLLCLAFLAAVFSPAGGGRGRWALASVMLAFITFMVSRHELRIFLGPLVAAAGVGVLIRRVRGDLERPPIWIALIVLASFLWLPLPESRADMGVAPTRGVAEGPAYRCQALGIIDVMLDPPGEADEGGLMRRWRLFLSELPQYTALFVFVLLLLAAFGARGRWLGYAAGGTLLFFVFAFSWVQYDLGTAQATGKGPEAAAWWGGCRQVADTWRARFFVFMPALAAAVAEIRAPQRDR